MFIGTGVGKLNNQLGARIGFVFTDAGEPGSGDTATLKVFEQGNNLVLGLTGDPSIAGDLDRGNLQTYKDNTCIE